MIVSREKMVSRKVEIDLSGPEGNAYRLIGLAGNLGKATGMNKSQVKNIQSEMMLSTYDMLIETLEKYFGDLIVLYK